MGRPKNPTTLFCERLKLEGKHSAFMTRVKALQSEGLTKCKSETKARKEFGYCGKFEEGLAAKRQEEMVRLEKLKVARETCRTARADKKIDDFEMALSGLPDKAQDSIEMAWISAHPAMYRQSRQKDKSKPVLLDADDVLYPPHGAAPSRAAVGALQHFANCPAKFFDGVLSEAKKQAGNASAEREAMEDDLAEVERLLKSVRASVRVPDPVNHGALAV
jgi:hypothetical protein